MTAVATLSPAELARIRRLLDEVRDAERRLSAILAEHDDPTGLGYSREDDEAPAQPTVRPHYGFHVTGRNQRPTSSPAGPATDNRRERASHVSARPGTEQGAAGLGDLAAPARAGAR